MNPNPNGRVAHGRGYTAHQETKKGRTRLHLFTELVDRCARFGLNALEEASQGAIAELQVKGSTPPVKTLQMAGLQKAISAVGMFSIFEATLQDALQCDNGFTEATSMLHQQGANDLKERFSDFQTAINALKHGRGRSYDTLVARKDKLPFRIKMPGENFFSEGDVSEIDALVEVDDAFVINCADLIRDVSRALQQSKPGLLL